VPQKTSVDEAVPGFLTAQDAADEIGCTDAYVRQMILSGRIRGARKVGRHAWLVPIKEACRIRDEPYSTGRRRKGRV